MILSHNFFHVIPPFPGENEMSFEMTRFWNVFFQIWDSNFVDILRPIFSFFGFYAVYIFIFLSGYGLTKKMNNLISMKYGSNIEWNREGLVNGLVLAFENSFKQIFKIIKLSLIGIMLIVFFRYLMGMDYDLRAFFLDYLQFLTFSENLIPGRLYFFVSSWWFLALIVQLYLLFPFLYIIQKKSKYISIGLTVIALIFGASCYLSDTNLPIFATPITNAVIFAFGIYFAEGHKIRKDKLIYLFLLTPLTFVFQTFFPISFLVICMALLCTYSAKKTQIFLKKHPLLLEFVLFLGSISMYCYIIHTELRNYAAETLIHSSEIPMFDLHMTYLGYLFMTVIVSGFIVFLKSFLAGAKIKKIKKSN